MTPDTTLDANPPQYVIMASEGFVWDPVHMKSFRSPLNR